MEGRTEHRVQRTFLIRPFRHSRDVMLRGQAHGHKLLRRGLIHRDGDVEICLSRLHPDCNTDIWIVSAASGDVV